MASKTGWISVGELLITFRISLVAVCRSSASVNSRSRAWSCPCTSAKLFSRTSTLAPSSFADWRATGGLASLDLAGLGPPRIGLPLPPSNRPGTHWGNPPGRARGRIASKLWLPGRRCRLQKCGYHAEGGNRDAEECPRVPGEAAGAISRVNAPGAKSVAHRDRGRYGLSPQG